MRVRILSETPLIAGKCGEVVEADENDATIKALLRDIVIEPETPEPPPGKPGK
jgi:hypothetical protein